MSQHSLNCFSIPWDRRWPRVSRMETGPMLFAVSKSQRTTGSGRRKQPTAVIQICSTSTVSSDVLCAPFLIVSPLISCKKWRLVKQVFTCHSGRFTGRHLQPTTLYCHPFRCHSLGERECFMNSARSIVGSSQPRSLRRYAALYNHPSVVVLCCTVLFHVFLPVRRIPTCFGRKTTGLWT